MMKERILTGITLILILVAVFLSRVFTNYVFDLFIILICIMGVFESCKIFSKMGYYNSLIVSLLYPVSAYILFLLSIKFTLPLYYAILMQIALILLLITLSFVYFNIFKKNTNNEIKTRNLKINTAEFAFNKSVHTIFSMLYPSLLLLMLIPINHLSDLFNGQAINNFDNLSFFALLLAFIIPVLTDTFSMIVGSLFGGRKLCKSISPNKTISGAVGGVVMAVLLGCVVFIIFNAIPNYNILFGDINLQLWHILTLTFIASIICQCGDLFESLLKRKADLKDSGNSLPGHGGVLDRVDSHCFNAVIILLFFVILL